MRPTPHLGSALRRRFSAWIAPGAVVGTNVRLGKKSSVWYNSVVRGDVAVGPESNIQDGSVVLGDANSPTAIGVESVDVFYKGVTVGHAARIVSSTIGSYSLVGIGSVIVHAELQERSQVAAGAVVHPGSVVQTGQLWGGNPARYLRDMKPEESAFLEESARIYVKNADAHRSNEPVE
ncbi:hypothetical protein PBRA_000774 [Plasmodiophora brassicae]|uniref:Gamma carbonic anhydrase family protein n=1 Tax=Plasmodiophora brassicae TaxID=37360 RepID=A0A0G4IQE6_PLABS|nr:hypothetical protein PBRA_000774 [Plasmodiophora brassicae]